MTQDERLDFLLRTLLAEREEYAAIRLPDGLADRRRVVRRPVYGGPPTPAREGFLRVQGVYLLARPAARGVARGGGDLPLSIFSDFSR